MRKVSLVDYADTTIKEWMKNQVSSGRSFPDFRDGLKDITRTIVQSLYELSNGTRKNIKLQSLMGKVTDFKEGSEKTNMDIFYRMTLSEYPILDATNHKLGGKQNTINIITGVGSKMRYIETALTPLGEYLMKYEAYFKPSSIKPITGDKPRWEYIRTPLPVSLLIPQINLADGISNSAPGLDLIEVIDAFILHIQKDKNTTTAELAQHIKGVSVNPNTTILMTNQAVHDLIEHGVMKFTQLANIEIYKKDVLIKGLPYKTFGMTIKDNLTNLIDKGLNGDWSRGLTTFQMTQILPENTDESIITFSYKLNKGFTVEDMRQELYQKTKLKSVIVYENIVNDFDAPEGKVLTIKSVRSTFDYHYDEAIELKTLQINSKIRDLEARFGDAVFMEKITKPIVAKIVGAIVTEPSKRTLAKEYLTSGHRIFKQYLLDEKSFSSQAYHHIAHILPEFKPMLMEKIYEIMDAQGIGIEEATDMVLTEEIPSEWADYEIKLIFTEQYLVLYKLDKRDEALQIIQNYMDDLEFLRSSLELENIKGDIIRELELLKMQYSNQPKNEKLFALPFQEREKMKEYRKRALKEIKNIPVDLPVNVLISEDGYARLSFSLSDSIPNLKYVMQVTMADNLVIVNRVSDSRKIAVNSLTMKPQKILDFVDTLFVIPQDHNYLFEYRYVLVTSKGRVSCVTDKAFHFKNKEIRIGLQEDETIVFARRVPQYHFDNGDVLIMKTSDNKLKGISLFDLSLKGTLVEFYSMFNSPTTDLVDSASIVPFDTANLLAWKSGWETTYTNKIRCRNVSKPLDINFSSPDAQFTYGKTLSWGDGYPICDFQGITGESGFVTLTPPFSGEDVSVIDEDISFNSLSELKLIEIHSTVSRLDRGPFPVTNIQLEIIANKYGGGV